MLQERKEGKCLKVNKGPMGYMIGSIVVGNVRFIVWIKKIGVGVDQNKKEIVLIIIFQEESI
ncbi:MAG: hypothetical protein WCF06_04590 [Nitrososphaeraceae archaeon]